MPLTAQEQALITAATNAIAAVPRFTAERTATDHTVGAACLASDGRIFTGINTPHFTGGPCAENAAFSLASASGISSLFSPGTNNPPVTLVLVVAVLNDGRGIISPCGRCRQVMNDMFPDIRVIIQDEEGVVRTVGMPELLPYTFSWPWKAKIKSEEEGKVERKVEGRQIGKKGEKAEGVSGCGGGEGGGVLGSAVAAGILNLPGN